VAHPGKYLVLFPMKLRAWEIVWHYFIWDGALGYVYPCRRYYTFVTNRV